MSVCVCVWLNRTDILCLPILVVDPFKSSYKLFDIWME